MDIILLWLFLILGLILLTISIKKGSLINWLLCFWLAAYLITFVGDLVVEYQMLTYPVQLIPHFRSSALYEYLLLPLICVYYYQATVHKSLSHSIWRAFIYSGLLTAFEVILEVNTDLIHYITWNWFYSLAGQFVLLLLIRWLMRLIAGVVRRRRGRRDG
ncbi:CBO0543 family protein [Lentibacillus salicampi]|uniref:Uncharacterized protein n=1 Tax=Lentibacillus salicampi TaxID=175306 RepID=A0A4Y9AG31_9BACI|nr:CBO0543 family protein [Lentibacillus salicampi]TFJ94385.1 hypothetical protein E4U82_00255 [Lentibacillus salicampi]